MFPVCHTHHFPPVERKHQRYVRYVQEQHQTGDQQREQRTEDHQPQATDQRQQEQADLHRAGGAFARQTCGRRQLNKWRKTH